MKRGLQYSRLSDFKIKKLIWHFSVDVNATQTAKLTGINRIFGIFLREGHVYTELIPDAKKVMLQGVIKTG